MAKSVNLNVSIHVNIKQEEVLGENALLHRILHSCPFKDNSKLSRHMRNLRALHKRRLLTAYMKHKLLVENGFVLVEESKWKKQ